MKVFLVDIDGTCCDDIMNEDSHLYPFESARKVITNNPEILDLCKDVPLKAYELNGGQLRDWTNPFSGDDEEFKKWVFYQKGLKVKDKTGRTFWFHPKWKDFCPY